ncbi:lipopolysaccharide biosynthesis protein [Vibrio japonicus]|uniref:Lipopolysaccharide biosynthesis protein n=1 Tax=Vibrio japonicus TaxID=1824638 RepID=A0ABY5LEQ4_9VIBR|nr:lipopolysaccharide biosynthesis protein [Vibrio japonicus]UUM30479.1 lipopolysaccharide biosynthesis protein [Vibrio japonicus]
MKTLVFLGYKEDYEQVEIDALRRTYHVHHIEVSKFTKRLISNAFFLNKKLQHYVFKKIIQKKIATIEGIDYIFLTDSLRHIRAAKGLKFKKIVLFRNVFDGSYLHELDEFEVYSFEDNDCIKYGFKCFNVPAPSLYVIDTLELKRENDVSFVGLDKGRGELLNGIKRTLDSCDVKCNITIFQKHKALTYNEYLEAMLNTNAVLEITSGNQASSTMRIIEAIYSERKIISNNKHLLTHQMYHKDNFLIFKDLEDLANQASSFLKIPFNKHCCNADAYKAEYIYDQIINQEKGA